MIKSKKEITKIIDRIRYSENIEDTKESLILLQKMMIPISVPDPIWRIFKN